MTKRPLASEYQLFVTNISVQVLPANNKRVAIVISPPDVGTVTFRFGQTAVAGQGLIMSANAPPFIIDIETVGEALQKDVQAVSTGFPGSNVWLLDVFEA